MEDQRPNTIEHIEAVRDLIEQFIFELQQRAECHDASKLVSPEREVIDVYTPKLKGTTYGSDEYKQHLKGMGAALSHHYTHNRHHPEHFASVDDMNLVDIVEMFCDWMAATRRHSDGDIARSIKINKDRFNFSELLTKILQNTVSLFK